MIAVEAEGKSIEADIKQMSRQMVGYFKELGEPPSCPVRKTCDETRPGLGYDGGLRWPRLPFTLYLLP